MGVNGGGYGSGGYGGGYGSSGYGGSGYGGMGGMYGGGMGGMYGGESHPQMCATHARCLIDREMPHIEMPHTCSVRYASRCRGGQGVLSLLGHILKRI